METYSKRKKRREREYKQATYHLGGLKMYVMNYVKRGEYRFNVVNTSGEIFKTNDKSEFMRYLEEI